MTDSSLDGWRRLGCAILLRAYKDAVGGNGHSYEARVWLGGRGARLLVSMLDLDEVGLDHALAKLSLASLQTIEAVRCDGGGNVSEGSQSHRRTVRDIHEAEVIGQWLAETDRAISALGSFRSCLETWQNGNGPRDPKALGAILAKLETAGLAEWAEWCPAAGGLDVLAEAIGDDKANVQTAS